MYVYQYYTLLHEKSLSLSLSLSMDFYSRKETEKRIRRSAHTELPPPKSPPTKQTQNHTTPNPQIIAATTNTGGFELEISLNKYVLLLLLW